MPTKFQQALANKRYILSVKLLLKGDCDDHGARRIAHGVTGIIELEGWDEEWNQLTESELVGEEPKPIEIGYISGWRTLSSNPNKVLLWSDRVNSDVCSAFNWLIAQRAEFGVEAALFIDQVVLKPCWRGQQLALRAVATYLDLVGCKFVFLQVAPLDVSHLTPQQQDSIKHRLRRYWQKLGLKHYDPANNIVWTDHWQCPQWLQSEDDYTYIS
ncbi:hypothetical protein [Leptolyngbya sp. FACHB-261]|uniref:hypothetical protein n=1 Tax=Leptolyngbya sp. FACHB-261 TaxID=2692806 RepID=UPI001684B74B|nr:hypothetical protein [Leptolyngbya sp. FACHB-261]MBD2100404.1 hypothetical protein [Leptolyngbya sp. FACHB-261]